MGNQAEPSIIGKAVGDFLSKIPEFTQRQAMILIGFGLVIVTAGVIVFSIVKHQIENSLAMDAPKAAPSLVSQPVPTIIERQPVIQGIGPGAQVHGPVTIHHEEVGGDKLEGIFVQKVVKEATKFERVYFVESKGPNYPIAMPEHLADSPLVRIIPNCVGVAIGRTSDPVKELGNIENMIKLDGGTEVEELSFNAKEELKTAPPGIKMAGKFFAQAHAKVRVIDGPHKGREGFVLRQVLRKDRRPAVDED